MLNLATKLKELANNLGISDVEAAKRCGLDRRRYGHYTTGRSRPNYETLITICNKLGTSPNILLDFNDQNSSIETQQLLAICQNLDAAQIQFLIAAAETLIKKANK